MCLFSLFPSLLCCRGWRDALCRFSVGLPDWLDLLYATSVRFHQKISSSFYACPGVYNNQSCSNCTDEWPTLPSFSSLLSHLHTTLCMTHWMTDWFQSQQYTASIHFELDIMQVYVVVYIKLFLRVFPPQHSFLTILNCIKLVWIRRGRYMISFTVYWE